MTVRIINILIGLLIAGAGALGANYVPMILKINPEAVDQELAELKRQRVVVLRHRDNLVLAYVPESSVLARVAPAPDGEEMPPMARRMVPTLDKARQWYGAGRVQSGEGLPRAYTGAGVVVGFCDIGFDPLHVAFLDSEGHSRVRRLVHYNESTGKRYVYEGDEAYKAWRTDNSSETHATHVGGILAGGYQGNDYYGVATGADIVATVSEASDVGLLAGAEDILDYARETGRPAVINMSMGYYIGPRDGTSLFCQYLDKIGEEAIVCLSSGNEGSVAGGVSVDFTEETPAAGALCYNTDYAQFDMRGLLEVWGRDDSPLRLRLTGHDGASGHKVVFQLPWVDTSEPFAQYFRPRDYPDMASCFRGLVYMEGGVSEDNGRSYVTVMLDTHTDEHHGPTRPWARYVWGVEISGEPGTHADLSSDCQRLVFRKHPDYPAPVTSLSISDLTTGRNTVSVGMYVSRDDTPRLNGNSYPVTDSQRAGTIDHNSSYGTLPDGRILPHTVGPGNAVISAYSTHYMQTSVRDVLRVGCAVAEGPYGTGYWGVNTGTSMSCPFVAGYIATWLEANPALTVHDVQRVLELTNDRSHSHADDPRNGGGWFRPYEGLLEVLGLGGVNSVGGATAKPSMEWRDGMLDIYNPGMRQLQLKVYTSDGKVLASQTLGADLHLRTALPDGPGIFLVSLAMPDSKPIVQKIAK